MFVAADSIKCPSATARSIFEFSSSTLADIAANCSGINLLCKRMSRCNAGGACPELVEWVGRGFAFWFSKIGSILTPRLQQVLAGATSRACRSSPVVLDVARVFQVTRIKVECCGDERFVNARRVNPTNFLTELKRRDVYRAAVAYGVVAWFLTQLTTQV